MTRAAFALALTLAAAPALAFDASKLEFERPVENVNGPGLYHVEVDATLWQHAKLDGLGDVRIVGPDGNEVPWLLRPVPPPQQAKSYRARLVDDDVAADGTVTAVLDLGASVPHGQVALAVTAGADFARRTHLEASTDDLHWTPLASGAWLFRVTLAGVTGAETTLQYPTTQARYLRVTLEADDGAPPRITGGTAAFVPPEAHVPLRLLPSATPQPLPESGVERANAWVVDLGTPGVPIAELALTIDDDAFVRPALLSAADQPPAWKPLTATLLYRAAPDEAHKLAVEHVRIPAGGARQRWLRLSVLNGAADPLRLRDVSPGYVDEELVFRAARGGAYALYVGGDVPPARYDGAAILRGEQPTLTASLATMTPNPTYAHLSKPTPSPQAGAPRRSHALPIVVAVAAVVALVAVALLLARRRR